jgi:GTPase SAR1 family protein
MERLRKLKLIDWTQANNSLNRYFEGNKSKLAAHLKISRTTITAFFNEKNMREAEFRKICLALRLNWEAVSTVELPGSPPPFSPSSNESPPSSQPLVEDEDIEQIVAKVRLHCCTEILAKHREIQLFNLKRIPVDHLFVDVYVLEELASQRFATLRDFPEVWNEQNGVSWQTLERVWMGGRKYRSSGIDIANQCSRLMILGKPGSGKTTFIKHLAVACCEGLFQPELIPVLIELRAVEVEKFNLLQLLQRFFDRDEATTLQLLKAGRVLILLDGLDEVPNQWRERVQREINRFSDQQYANRMIVTCRTQTAEYRIKDFEYVEAADFDAKQKQSFVRNWFAIAEKNPSSWLARTLKTVGLNSDDGGHKLLQQIEASPRLKELAGTPVLLSLICWVYTVDGKLPQTRSALYSSGLRLLLQQWDENRAIKPESRIGQQRYQSLDLHDKQLLLSEVAYQKFKQPGNFVLFDETEIISIRPVAL